MNNNTPTLQELKSQLDALHAEMPTTWFEMQQRDKSSFLISREIERLESPNSYAQNSEHWDGYEMRL